MKDTKTIQTLASVSLIGGPLSIIVGGVLLSTASLVCGIVAFVMLRKNLQADGAVAPDAIAQALTRQAIIGMAVSGLALLMNAASLAMMLPAILDAAQTGDISALFGGSAADEASSSAGSGSAFGGDSANSTPDASQNGRSSVWG